MTTFHVAVIAAITWYVLTLITVIAGRLVWKLARRSADRERRAAPADDQFAEAIRQSLREPR